MTITQILPRKIGADDVEWGTGSFTYIDPVTGLPNSNSRINSDYILTSNGAMTMQAYMDALAVSLASAQVDLTALTATVTALDLAVVKLTGNQTIAGIKTFSSFPLTPSSAPTTDYQVANRKFVLDSVALIAIGGIYYNTTGVNPATELGYGTWSSILSLSGPSYYPPAHNDTYVKATTKFSTDQWPYYATDPTKNLTGTEVGNGWTANANTSQRFHIDIGSAKLVTRIYYENRHHSGTVTDGAAKNFTLWGALDDANGATAFAALTYATDTYWTQIGGSLQFYQHVAADVVDPRYITFANTVAYRYYAIKIADAWGGTYIGLRRIELQIASTQLWVRTA